MRTALVIILIALWAGCATADPIDNLVTNLSSSHGMWINGIAPIIELPETATTEQVVERVFKMTGFDEGQVTRFKILETRTVHIQGSVPDLYTAVLVETKFGEKIVLLRYEGKTIGWWSRVYKSKGAV